MKKRLMFSLSILPLLMLVSCSGSPEEQSATPPSPPTGQASPPPVAPPPATPPAGSQATNPPVISDKEIAQRGLIPSTNPQQRLKEVQQARNNPFSLIPIVAQVSPVGGSNNLGNLQGTGNNLKNSQGMNNSGNGGEIISKTGDKTLKQQQVVPVENRVGSTGVCRGQGKDPGSTIIKEGKTDLQPEQAYKIEVSGIINLPNGKTVAIVRDSDQPVSQNVTQGSRLGNGLVMVKSIDTSTQQVVLQQQGFEKLVYRAVGQPVEKVSSTFTPSQIEVQKPGPDGFGLIRNLMLDKVNLGKINTEEAGSKLSQTRLYGTLCNDGSKTIDVNNVKIQIQDAQTNNILDATWNRIAETSVEMEPGQKVEFDFSVPRLRGREKGKVYIKFINWR
jgi:hypothetical protein